ncbi:MAG: imidazoleglycerol-phosphate dehydratase HisB [Promethearchaeota archaeon]
MELRKAEIKRETKETNIIVEINLDGDGKSEISTTIGFFDHMLTLFAKHSKTNLKVKAIGDLEHHLIEDVGICLGKAIEKVLGEKRGIQRYGDKIIPMDESLALCALDLGGRIGHHIDLKTVNERVEDCQTEDIMHFFETLAQNAKMNLHIVVQYGNNDHHKIEAAFKAFAHAFREAKAINVGDNEILSTKGVL